MIAVCIPYTIAGRPPLEEAYCRDKTSLTELSDIANVLLDSESCEMARWKLAALGKTATSHRVSDAAQGSQLLDEHIFTTLYQYDAQE